MTSRYIVDGYNVIHALGFLYAGAGPDGLQRARLRLFEFLLDSFKTEAEHITVVFDAAGAPPGVKAVHAFKGLQIRFALTYDEADDLIEELIAADAQPRTLVVISSDHRLVTAARRRSAQGWTCMEMLDVLEERRRALPPSTPRAEERRLPSAEETERWTREFSDLADDPGFRELFDPWPFKDD